MIARIRIRSKSRSRKGCQSVLPGGWEGEAGESPPLPDRAAPLVNYELLTEQRQEQEQEQELLPKGWEREEAGCHHPSAPPDRQGSPPVCSADLQLPLFLPSNLLLTCLWWGSSPLILASGDDSVDRQHHGQHSQHTVGGGSLSVTEEE